ncbi:Hemolymph lipopolysaccharide-binding protein, partial [Gryllus bimaculatus]
ILTLLAWKAATSSGQESVFGDDLTNNTAGSESPFLEAAGDGQQCPAVCPACPATPGCPGCPACPNAPPCPRRIPPGYTQHGRLGYYKMHYELRTWPEAKAACEREGGYLAVLNSQEEANLAGSFLQRYNIVGHLLVGFFDVTKNGTYITVLNEPLSSTGYEGWASSEPNHVGTENCGSYFPNQGLNDEACNVPKAFLCELFA